MGIIWYIMCFEVPKLPFSCAWKDKPASLYLRNYNSKETFCGLLSLTKNDCESEILQMRFRVSVAKRKERRQQSESPKRKLITCWSERHAVLGYRRRNPLRQTVKHEPKLFTPTKTRYQVLFFLSVIVPIRFNCMYSWVGNNWHCHHLVTLAEGVGQGNDGQEKFGRRRRHGTRSACTIL